MFKIDFKNLDALYVIIVSSTIWLFLSKLFNSMFHKTHQLSGDLMVMGSGSSELVFDGKIKNVLVYFDDEVISMPCNPEQEDILYFESSVDGGKHMLKIHWSVSSARKIVWQLNT